MDFGWKKKAERLRMVILSGAHQLAKELPPGLEKILETYRRAARTGDANGLQEEMERITQDHGSDPKLLWEPLDCYGWQIQATLYLLNGQLWWLLHAARRSEKAPSDKEVAFIEKIIALLGGDPKRDMIIGPTSSFPRRSSSPGGAEPLPFGWWTWFNRFPLYEIRVNRNKKGKEMLRIVPLGAREADGYRSLDLLEKETSSGAGEQ